MAIGMWKPLRREERYVLFDGQWMNEARAMENSFHYMSSGLTDSLKRERWWQELGTETGEYLVWAHNVRLKPWQTKVSFTP